MSSKETPQSQVIDTPGPPRVKTAEHNIEQLVNAVSKIKKLLDRMENKSVPKISVPQEIRDNVAALDRWSQTANNYARTIESQAQRDIATGGAMNFKDLFLQAQRGVIDPEYRETKEYRDVVGRAAASFREWMGAEVANSDILKLIEKPALKSSNSVRFDKKDTILVKRPANSDDKKAEPQDWVLLDELASGVEGLELNSVSVDKAAPKTKNKSPLAGK